jgi:hypothetical protein
MAPIRSPRPRTLLSAEIVLVLLGVALTVPSADAAIPLALLGLPVLLYGWLGARIAERAAENRIGWLLSAAALTAAAGISGEAYGRFGRLHVSEPLPFAGTIRTLTEIVPPPVVAVCFLIVFLSFPTGRLPSPRWRPVVWIVVAAGMVMGLALLGDPASPAALLIPRVSGAIPFREVLPDVALTLVGAAFLLTVASLFVRSRRVSPDERREIRGLLVTLVVMAAAVPPFAVFGRTEDGSWLIAFFAVSVFALGFLFAVPFSLSISMLR